MPDNVTITLTLNLKPEAVAPFRETIRQMIKGTAEQKGFRNIKILMNKDDPNQMILIEEWASEEDYNNYIAWRTGRGDMDMMDVILAAPPQMRIWPTVVASI